MHEVRPIATDGPVVWCVCQPALCKTGCTDRGRVWDGGPEAYSIRSRSRFLHGEREKFEVAFAKLL